MRSFEDRQCRDSSAFSLAARRDPVQQFSVDGDRDYYHGEKRKHIHIDCMAIRTAIVNTAYSAPGGTGEGKGGKGREKGKGGEKTRRGKRRGEGRGHEREGEREGEGKGEDEKREGDTRRKGRGEGRGHEREGEREGRR